MSRRQTIQDFLSSRFPPPDHRPRMKCISKGCSTPPDTDLTDGAVTYSLCPAHRKLFSVLVRVLDDEGRLIENQKIMGTVRAFQAGLVPTQSEGVIISNRRFKLPRRKARS